MLWDTDLTAVSVEARSTPRPQHLAHALSASERLRRALFVLATLIAVSAIASACGTGSNGGSASSLATATATSPSMGSSATGESTVEISNFMFMPMSLTVTVGTTVTWKFDDSTEHTVAADDASFTSPALANGATYTHTFNTAGTVAYRCSIHPYMIGTIVVK